MFKLIKSYLVLFKNVYLNYFVSQRYFIYIFITFFYTFMVNKYGKQLFKCLTFYVVLP